MACLRRSRGPFGWLLFGACLLAATVLVARAAQPRRGGNGLASRAETWKIDGATREALVVAPHAKGKEAAPVIFAFHGHGGTAGGFAARADFQKYWPEAIIVYMQGIPTPGKTDPEGVRSGWQHEVGAHGDRDLKFFDAVLESLRHKYAVDDRRIYATGHSNGGGFTYLLWQARPAVFAAYAPCAAGFRAGQQPHTPAPVFHLAGKQDAIVPFENQQRVMQSVKRINRCQEQGTSWGADCTIYSSTGGTPLVTCIHPGGHAWPPEAAELIVRFFKAHTKPESAR